MARQDPQLKIRLPEELKDAIARIAAESGRSMNAEIVHRLERSISFEDEYGTLDEVIASIWEKIEELERMYYSHDEALNPGRYDRD